MLPALEDLDLLGGGRHVAPSRVGACDLPRGEGFLALSPVYQRPPAWRLLGNYWAEFQVPIYRISSSKNGLRQGLNRPSLEPASSGGSVVTLALQ